MTIAIVAQQVSPFNCIIAFAAGWSTDD